MSYDSVQAVLQRTLADADFRSRLFADPEAALVEFELTPSEADALRSLYVETDPPRSAELDRRQSKRPFWLTH